MVWAAIAAAVLPQLVGGYVNYKSQKAAAKAAAQPQVVKNDYDFSRLKREALKAGFNPLTVLGHGGTGTRTTSPIPQLSSQGYVLSALSNGLSEFIGYQQQKKAVQNANSQDYVAGATQRYRVAGNSEPYVPAASHRGSLQPAHPNPIGGLYGTPYGSPQFEPVLKEPRRSVTSVIEVRSPVEGGAVGLLPNEEASIDIGDLVGTAIANPEYADQVAKDVNPYAPWRWVTYPLARASDGVHALATHYRGASTHTPLSRRIGDAMERSMPFTPTATDAPVLARQQYEAQYRLPRYQQAARGEIGW